MPPLISDNECPSNSFKDPENLLSTYGLETLGYRDKIRKISINVKHESKHKIRITN